MDNIEFNEFLKLDIRIGKVVYCEKIEGTENLLKLEVDTGSEVRTLVAGLAKKYSPEDLNGRQVPVLCNLNPRRIRGVLSQGMILASGEDDFPVLLMPESPLAPGSRVR